jgi:hypothetical protein
MPLPNRCHSLELGLSEWGVYAAQQARLLALTIVAIVAFWAMTLATVQGAVIPRSGANPAEKRIALVIGNSSYRAPLRSLKNPTTDAADMAASLRKLGFKVMTGTDLDQASMREKVASFAQEARSADVSLFYYAGHGFQMASRNYLVPVDAVLRSREDISRQTLDLRAAIGQIEGGPGIHLVFLDACRNDPMPSNNAETALAIPSGLARVGDAAGFLIAFATQPDKVAYDGAGRNSPFTQALLGHLGRRGQDLASLLIAVRRDVLATTGGYQRPFEESSIDRQFYFAPGSLEITSPETQLWQLAAGVRDADLVHIYLDRYPEGAYASEAQSLLKDVSLDKSDGLARSANLDEERLWEVVLEARTPTLLEYYLKRHPAGRYSAEARTLLSAVPKSETAQESPEAICERLATHPRDATANTSGTSLLQLSRNSNIAIEACGKAVADNPGMPHYLALMARTMAAAGHRMEAVRLYREAAEHGNLRALVSLGLITETGDGVPKDPKAALEFYERAAEGGSPDGAINLAVALIEGKITQKNVSRGVELLSRASQAGSAIATYNLGSLARDGRLATPKAAIDYFRRAAELGEARAFMAAAILLDEGDSGLQKDPNAAAEMLMNGIAADSGETLVELSKRSQNWSPDTIRALQVKLKQYGYYNGALNGKGSQAFVSSLKRWRSLGGQEAKG